MALIDVKLPKKYKDGEVLFEETLDAWRLATEEAFANLNLNLTQLAKDLFDSDYDYNNDGNQTLVTYLLQQITNLITGATPITGTSSDSFTINTDGNSSTLSTASLTEDRTHALPDESGTLATQAYVLARSVPVGSIIPHNDFNGTIAIDTDYWRYCDGSVLNYPASPLHGKTLDDMSNRFIVGFGTEGGGDIATAGTDAAITAFADSGVYTPAYLTGGTDTSPGGFGWQFILNPEFRITIDGVIRDIKMSGFPFFGSLGNKSIIAAIIQAAIRTTTGGFETCIFDTNHFVISSGDTSVTSAITVTSAIPGGTGTDISGPGYLDCAVGVGAVTAKAGSTTVTALTHGFVNGDSVTISGSTNYNGTFNISDCGTGVFNIPVTFVADDAAGIATLESNLIGIANHQINIAHTHGALGVTASGEQSADHTHTGPNHAHSVPAHYHGDGTLAIDLSGAHTHYLGTFPNIYGAENANGGATVTPLNFYVPDTDVHVSIENIGPRTYPVIITSSEAHTHPNSYFSGSVGNVDGSNGDAAFDTGNAGTNATGGASAAHTHDINHTHASNLSATQSIMPKSARFRMIVRVL